MPLVLAGVSSLPSGTRAAAERLLFTSASASVHARAKHGIYGETFLQGPLLSRHPSFFSREKHPFYDPPPHFWIISLCMCVCCVASKLLILLAK